MHTLNVFFVKKERCLIRKVAKRKEEEEERRKKERKQSKNKTREGLTTNKKKSINIVAISTTKSNHSSPSPLETTLKGKP
jgi:CO dehydrogenase/acetyl-CoA synthase beta subunit